MRKSIVQLCPCPLHAELQKQGRYEGTESSVNSTLRPQESTSSPGLLNQTILDSCGRQRSRMQHKIAKAASQDQKALRFLEVKILAISFVVPQLLRKNTQSHWVDKAAGTWQRKWEFWDAGLTQHQPHPYGCNTLPWGSVWWYWS